MKHWQQPGRYTQLRKCSARGFSLLGVLVAMFLLVTGVIVITRLMAQNEKTFGVAAEKLVAAGLAREGLELVQAKRDSNWFAPTPTGCGSTIPGNTKDSCWVVDICGPGGDSTADDYRFTIDYDAGAGIVIAPLHGAGQEKLYINNVTSLWTHVVSPELTPYSRVMSVDCSQRSATPPLVKVQAMVSWESRAREQEVVVQEQLYNWYTP